jgi:hypothetical protein
MPFGESKLTSPAVCITRKDDHHNTLLHEADHVETNIIWGKPIYLQSIEQKAIAEICAHLTGGVKRDDGLRTPITGAEDLKGVIILYYPIFLGHLQVAHDAIVAGELGSLEEQRIERDVFERYVRGEWAKHSTDAKRKDFIRLAFRAADKIGALMSSGTSVHDIKRGLKMNQSFSDFLGERRSPELPDLMHPM